MWEIFAAFVCLSMSGGFAHSSTDDSVTSFPQDVVGVKHALHFESDDEDICVTKVSKKDDCICTCCRKTHLERPMCHIFSVRKYDVSNAEVREALAHRLHTGQNKELICMACDKKLFGVSNSGLLSDVIASGEGAQSSVHTVSGSNILFDRPLGVLRQQNYPSMVPAMCTVQPTSSGHSQIDSSPKSEEALYTNKSSVSTQALYTCTCCRLQTLAR